MSAHRTWSLSWAARRAPLAALLLTPAAGALAATDAACRSFTAHHDGYLISTAFTIDAERHAVISPPQCAGALLWIRPLRLNADEYLILQKCTTADCSRAQVVRAWNNQGTMGPYPVLSSKIPIESGLRYLLWMQSVPLPGARTFRQIEREGQPLVFAPMGRTLQLEFAQQALAAARERGPTPVQSAVQKSSAYVATFRGGSSVWMRALRAAAGAGTP